MIKSSLFQRSILSAIVLSASALLMTGCQTNLGPWERQAYERPSVETPVHEVKVTPGSPLPFEQRLPAGNLNASPILGASN